MIFVNSMSDLFHERVPDEYIEAVARVMQEANWHTYQVLTKRAARMRRLLSSHLHDAAAASHIWWGVSVENRRHGLPRLRELGRSRAKVRFLSLEPLLEHVGTLDLSVVNWVIVGGESGIGARSIQPEWVESIQKQCQIARVPFFFKQWGGIRKSSTGRLLHGRTFDEFPTIVRANPPTQQERRRTLSAMTATMSCKWVTIDAARIRTDICTL